MHRNAIGNRSVSYNQESFVTAYYDVLIHGFTITKAGFQQNFFSFLNFNFSYFKIFIWFIETFAENLAQLGCYQASNSEKDIGILC